jgi:anti-anti-sigma regulatory factor
MRGQLLVVAGPDQGRTFTLEEGQTLVIGRGQNTETKLKDPQASRVHCQVRLGGGILHLTDSGSSTGTQVGDRSVVEHDLLPGDAFRIGATCIRFELESSPEAATVVMRGGSSGSLPAYVPEAHYQHLRTHADRGVLVLTLTESQVLDEEIAEGIRVEIIAAVSQGGARKVVLDFQAVKNASDAVVRPVISLHTRLQEQGGRLILCGLTGMASQVLRMSGLIGAPGEGVETTTDLPAAVARLQQGE